MFAVMYVWGTKMSLVTKGIIILGFWVISGTFGPILGQKAYARGEKKTIWYTLWPNIGPNVPEITQNPKIMIPYVTRDILVPHTCITQNILMCYNHNRVGKSSFFSLSGTHFDPIWVQMYPKSPKIPKSWILMLLGSFWYPIHASCQTFWYATSPKELKNLHFVPLRWAFWPNMRSIYTQNPPKSQNYDSLCY